MPFSGPFLDLIHYQLGVIPNLMLPKPQHCPPRLGKGLGNSHIPLVIAFDLWLPIVLPGVGHPAADRAFMPKTAVDKHHYLAGVKNEIRLARDVFGLNPPSPQPIPY